jgi:two-component system KDP operon response regulator KdpE
VLVVDDEPQILRALRTSLRAAGYEVATAGTVADALAIAALMPPEAMIVDLLLPDGTGTEVCREFRKWSASVVIVLSAVGDERDKVDALDAGADDYVTKPIGIEELLARLRAALRRTVPSAESMVTVGRLEIDLGKRMLRVSGEPVHLTPHQFDLLRVHIAQLRRKIEPDPGCPCYLLTEPGAGYRLVAPEPEKSLWLLNGTGPGLRAPFIRKLLLCRSETGPIPFGGKSPMTDLGAIAIALACFAFLFAILYGLDRL